MSALRNLRLLWPNVWPRGRKALQFGYFCCAVLLVIGRLVNLCIPIVNAKIVNNLYSVLGAGERLRINLIFLFGGLRVLQQIGTSGGLINVVRIAVWLRVQQYIARSLQLRLFTHLHSLPLSWHLSRKTGEMLRIMDRGTQSVVELVNLVLWRLLPAVLDVLIAMIYFCVAFDYVFAGITLGTMVTYVVVTIMITEWRNRFRRHMNRYDNQQRAKSVDAVLNYETVKYYNNENFEYCQYKPLILSFQRSEVKSILSWLLLISCQAFTVSAGLLLSCVVCVYYVVYGLQDLGVADYVLLVSYLQQLYTPLDMLGTYYLSIQQSCVDMENMCDLLREHNDVSDLPSANDLDVQSASIRFENVHFSYKPDQPVLRGISFEAQHGEKIALVGPSGGGKSTIIRLLFRFYDVKRGRILIDEQDISKVKQKSLRRLIGVVPQDTVLFNDTIKYNINYGRFGANDQEIEEVASAAQIDQLVHHTPAGFDANVGERGLRLSAGERQRLAIARTLLKAPPIVLLDEVDEATSSLDTETERNIQSTLFSLCHGRTAIIVAHRLSTVVDCDRILVIRDGVVAEQGTHSELLAAGGAYWSMWRAQSSSSSTTQLAADVAMPNRSASSSSESGLSFDVSSTASTPVEVEANKSTPPPPLTPLDRRNSARY